MVAKVQVAGIAVGNVDGGAEGGVGIGAHVQADGADADVTQIAVIIFRDIDVTSKLESLPMVTLRTSREKLARSPSSI